MAEHDEWHVQSDRQYQGLINKFWCFMLFAPFGGIGFVVVSQARARGAIDDRTTMIALLVVGLISVLMFLNGLMFPWGLIRLYRAHQKERDWILLRQLEEQTYSREANMSTANLMQQMKDESQ